MKQAGRSAQSLIRFEDVSIQRDGKQVLSGINWLVKPGENWVIMGNNGSGKTTLLEILMGYLWPQAGKVSVLGEVFGKSYLPELRKKIGFIAPWVFKRIPEYMIVRNVVASGMLAGVSYYQHLSRVLQSTVRKQLKFFGCIHLERKPFGSLSSGEQLKVAFSRALVSKPEILVLDEPFSLLDIGSRLNVYGVIDKLSHVKSGPSLIITTHHFEDILPVFTHSLLLKRGKIFKAGKIKEILTPKNLVAAFNLSKNESGKLAAKLSKD